MDKLKKYAVYLVAVSKGLPSVIAGLIASFQSERDTAFLSGRMPKDEVCVYAVETSNLELLKWARAPQFAVNIPWVLSDMMNLIHEFAEPRYAWGKCTMTTGGTGKKLHPFSDWMSAHGCPWPDITVYASSLNYLQIASGHNGLRYCD